MKTWFTAIPAVALLAATMPAGQAQTSRLPSGGTQRPESAAPTPRLADGTPNLGRVAGEKGVWDVKWVPDFGDRVVGHEVPEAQRKTGYNPSHPGAKSQPWVPTMPWAAAEDLVAAAKAGNAAAVRALVNRHVNVNDASADGTTALHWAVREGHLPIAEILIAASANVNVLNRYGVSPLSLAVSNGHAVLLNVLLDAGADMKTAEAALPDGQTLLMAAARASSVRCIDVLLAHGADTNATERSVGATALIWAAAENRPDAARRLLRAGADANARSAITRYPHTPPAVVGDPLEEGNSYIGQTVLPKGAWTPLMYAARQGATAVARVLVDSGANLDLTDPDGASALMLAVINGHYDMAALLLDAGADPNLADRTGATPLYAAVDMHTLASTFGRRDPPRDIVAGSVGAIQDLLSHGADPNARLTSRILKRVYNAGDPRLDEGATAFMRAARTADVPVMRMLMAAGADTTLTQKNANSPLLLAVGADLRGRSTADGAQERLEAIKTCLELGADINDVNAAGDTAAHLAVAAGAGAVDIIQLLAERGARFDVKNKQGRTPLDVAIRARDKSQEVVTLLRSVGAVETTSGQADASDPAAAKVD